MDRVQRRREHAAPRGTSRGRVGLARRGLDRWHALGRSVSVWHYLVAIALMPAVGLPVLAAQLVAERLSEASTAHRIEQDLAAFQALDRLRSALNDEATAGALAVVATQVEFPVGQLSAKLGLTNGSLASTRAATDRVFARVPAPLTTRLQGVGGELRALRGTMDSAIAAKQLTSLSDANLGYVSLGDQVSEAERAVAHTVASGGEGVISPRLLKSAHALEAIAAVAITVNRVGLFYGRVLAPPQARVKIDSQLHASTQAYQVRSADLGLELTPRLAQTWARIAADPQIQQFDRAVSNPADQPEVGSGVTLDTDTLKGKILPVAQAGAQVLTQLSNLLEQAAAETAAIARADADNARRRAVQSLVGTAAALAVTAAALLRIGGLLRRRLRTLAIGARRLSAGHLDPVRVDGPRELAATSEAINDAAASLRHVEAKAELLASGDLHSPELERPAPGPLGAAVDASVTRIVTAVREREDLQRELAYRASHDALTGLPNRAELDRSLAAALSRAQRAHTAVSVLFVDLDRFKACNDRLGHAAGDHVLRQVAERMRAAVRLGDIVGRLGGDEFVVIVEAAHTGPEVMELAERLVTALAKPFDYQGQRVQVGASIGVSGCDDGCGDGQVTPDHLLSEADAAAYRAKAAGGGVVAAYDQGLRGRLEARRELRAGIAAALRRNEFVLHCQPVVELPQARLCGFEALIRWDRPGVGLLAPDTFLPAVEGGDLIIEIGRWVLAAATRQFVEWSDHPVLRGLEVSVNLSGWHLLNPCVVEDVRAALQTSGLPPDRLIIEVTETVPVDDVHAVEHLRQLSALGVRLALDDFGTGHTSINQLLSLPIDILKLDRSLVSALSRTSHMANGSRPITDLMIEMAHSLNLAVVAEGVESPERLADLTDNNCDQAQGYLFSRPLPPAQARVWALGQLQPHRARPARHLC